MKAVAEITKRRVEDTKKHCAGRRLIDAVLIVTITITGPAWAATGGSKVVTYPAPAGETLSTIYQVEAGGQKVDVYSARVLDPPFAGKQ